MNGYPPHSFYQIAQGKVEGRHDWELVQFELANQLFRRSFLQGQVKRILCRLLRQPVGLLELAGQEPLLQAARELPGVAAVPVTRILGSEGRGADFDRDFHPRRASSRQRWVTIASLLLQENTMPAVDLIQVGDIYFVRDGHHRISAARALGQYHIDSHVTVWQVQFQPAEVLAEKVRPFVPGF